jgi:serine protease Do
MKGKTIAGLIGMATLALLGVGVFAAQNEGSHQEHQARTMTIRTVDGRPRLGVSIADVNSDKARELKLPGEYGALVKEVEPDTPAAKAGFEANDVILEFDGERVRSAAELRRLTQDTPPGRSVAVKVSRGGQTRNLSVKLEAASSEEMFPEMEMPRVEIPEIHVPEFNFEFFGAGPRLGISAQELTSQLAQYFGVAQGKGVLVEQVESGSAAEKAGLKAGDCIVRVGEAKVESVADLHRALGERSSEKHEVTLTIVRDRREQALKVELEASPRMMRRRIAGDEFPNFDPIRLRAELRASGIALREARRALESERHGLLQQRRQMLDELRRELGKRSWESNWVVD